MNNGQGVSEKQLVDGDGVVSHHLPIEQPLHSVCNTCLTPPAITTSTPSLFLSLSPSLQSKLCKPHTMIWYSGHGNRSILGGFTVLSIYCML